MAFFTLGLDLDGVCGDYVEEFRIRTARATGVEASTLPNPTSWSFVESWPVVKDEDHYLQLHHDAVRDGMFRGMPPMEGVHDALWRLSDADVYIRVVTHRLIGKGLHQMAAADTVAWLDRHDIPYRDLCFMGRKAQVEADIYIDDAPHNVLALREAGKEVIIFDASYNKHLPGLRAHNWQEAADLVLAAKADWDARQI